MPRAYDDILDTLTSVFGHGGFRPGQAEIVEHILDGGQALILMPTGGGRARTSHGL